MIPAIELEGATVYLGDCRQILRELPDNSVDSIVTDPPYELGFMGKKWDSSGIAYDVDVWEQCLRVLKPGGHLLAFGGSRTWHRLAVAIEDAGYEVRDSIAWLYGSGFPKSLDVSKAIDKRLGAEREVIGAGRYENRRPRPTAETNTPGAEYRFGAGHTETAPSSSEAKKWQGWGTALKPAFEPIVVARKPLIGTVAENVLEWGTGGLNIDGSRIGSEQIKINNYPQKFDPKNNLNGLSQAGQVYESKSSEGRWPANVMLDEVTAELLDQQSGDRPGGQYPAKRGNSVNTNFASGQDTLGGARAMGDSGGASRFFYVAKANKRDRNEGLDGLLDTSPSEMVNRVQGSAGMSSPRAGAGRTSGAKNFHPTVKPTDLMRYLIKLVTPPGGLVLDPFTGSGSTGKAALLDGFDFVGAELTDEYLPIIEGRLKWALENREDRLF
jgi:site-specific DNA-methyltransferase (adenine-specific)